MRPHRFKHFRSLGICAAIAVGASLGVLAPSAMAAPANDAFVNRTELGARLPVQETESNVGATRESGEPSLGLMGGAGHSLWWGWEAPATEWVTVSTCQSPFPTVVGIFEGTELGHLTRVAEGNLDEGPSCLYEGGRTYTFKAQAGHHYAIGADGNGFYVPGPPGTPQPPPPVVEGEITLTIEATPRPPNDDFADATPIEQAVLEEPGGARRFVTFTDGYNWNATKQPGEPDHAGDPGGASIWYSWTAPESGEAAIGYGVGGPGLLAVYTGNVVDELTPVASTSADLVGIHIPVVGGTKYMIAVDGKRSETTGEAAVGAYDLTVFEQLAPGLGSPAPLPPAGCDFCDPCNPCAPPILHLPTKAKPTTRQAHKIKALKARRARARARARRRHQRLVAHRRRHRHAGGTG